MGGHHTLPFGDQSAFSAKAVPPAAIPFVALESAHLRRGQTLVSHMYFLRSIQKLSIGLDALPVPNCKEEAKY